MKEDEAVVDITDCFVLHYDTSTRQVREVSDSHCTYRSGSRQQLSVSDQMNDIGYRGISTSRNHIRKTWYVNTASNVYQRLMKQGRDLKSETKRGVHLKDMF